MRRVTEVPEAVQQALHDTGVVLAFASFTDVDGTESEARDAVAAALEYEYAQMLAYWNATPQATPWAAPDRAVLPQLTSRTLTREAFLGDYVDVASGTRLFSKAYISARGTSMPDLWKGGHFGYAFSTSPYGIRVDAERMQALFDGVCAWILPAGRTCTILDWGSPVLLDLWPDYFEPGTEWWGVFLFTVHVAEERQLTVILGAATD